MGFLSDIRGRVSTQPLDGQPGAGRFPLLRYFIGASVLIIGVVTALSAFLFVRVAEANFTDQIERRSAQEVVHFGAIFYRTVWFPSQEQRSAEGLEGIDQGLMQQFADGTSFGLNIVQVNVLDADGVTRFSTDPATVGAVGLQGEAYTDVVEHGVPFSTVQRDESIRVIDGSEHQIDILNTYGPLFNVNPEASEEGNLVGVLQIVQDVTSDLSTARSDSLRNAILGSVLMALVLFTLLLLIVFRADRNIGRSHRQLLKQQSELEAAHAHNVQAAKLAAVGELVAGVAHELNNPLSGIWGLARLLQDEELDARAREEVTMIHNEAERSVRIVRNLLSFARNSTDGMTYTSINDAVQAAVDIWKHQLEMSNIELVPELAPDLPNTMADAHEVQQLALNLIVNAEQAMEDAQGGGRLLVKTERAGAVIRLIVSDNGPGISKEVQEKLFDPFFTTKDVGKGTGLGLSICYGIVQSHGGTIRVESEPSYGATFVVELPIVAERAASPEGQAVESGTLE